MVMEDFLLISGNGRAFHANTKTETSTVDTQTKYNSGSIRPNATDAGLKKNGTASCHGVECPVAENSECLTMLTSFTLFLHGNYDA